MLKLTSLRPRRIFKKLNTNNNLLVKNLYENKSFIQDPLSFLNIVIGLLVKRGNTLFIQKQLYNFFYFIKEKKLNLLQLFENVITENRMVISTNNFKIRGKPTIVPGLIAPRKARIKLIREIINLTKKETKSINDTMNHFLVELENLQLKQGSIFEGNKLNYKESKFSAHIGKKVFEKVALKKKFKNASPSKKTFFQNI